MVTVQATAQVTSGTVLTLLQSRLVCRVLIAALAEAGTGQTSLAEKETGAPRIPGSKTQRVGLPHVSQLHRLLWELACLRKERGSSRWGD